MWESALDIRIPVANKRIDITDLGGPVSPLDIGHWTWQLRVYQWFIMGLLLVRCIVCGSCAVDWCAVVLHATSLVIYARLEDSMKAPCSIIKEDTRVVHATKVRPIVATTLTECRQLSLIGPSRVPTSNFDGRPDCIHHLPRYRYAVSDDRLRFENGLIRLPSRSKRLPRIITQTDTDRCR
jgi:hypothetical protein